MADAGLEDYEREIEAYGSIKKVFAMADYYVGAFDCCECSGLLHQRACRAVCQHHGDNLYHIVLRPYVLLQAGYFPGIDWVCT